MGDNKRFDLFANYIVRHADYTTRIADIAGGKGTLQTRLRQKGFLRVETFDKRSKHREGHFIRQLFTPQRAQGFQLLVGMHPDEATDVILVSAIQNHIPFIVCPCCVKPSAVPYSGKRSYSYWLMHLINIAQRGRYNVTLITLKMSGKNVILHGRPR